MRQTTTLLCLLVISTVLPLFAESSVKVDLPTRARGAALVVVGEVERVRAEYQRNEFGDRLIVSVAEVRVREVLKGTGSAGDALTVEVEGGTVDGITLRVSDMPTVAPGEQAVFFVNKNRQGHNVPHLRGQGILEFDPNGRVSGTGLTIDDVRRAVAAGNQAR
jgi:hypothetical protein